LFVSATAQARGNAATSYPTRERKPTSILPFSFSTKRTAILAFFDAQELIDDAAGAIAVQSQLALQF
jgi:hypothetical protein